LDVPAVLDSSGKAAVVIAGRPILLTINEVHLFKRGLLHAHVQRA
jgi:hypothetical protein